MKLRKEFNKSKKNREQKQGVTEIHKVNLQESTADQGWVAPVYSDSRSVNIDITTAVRNHCVAVSNEYEETEYYKVLRTRLRLLGKQNNWRTVMVSSATPGEGKTVTAINLATTLAREYSSTVLLVDADLRMQMVHRYLGYESRLGLLDYLEGANEMSDIITWPGIDKFTIISGDRVVDESSELISSPRMQLLMKEMKHRYDDRYVIFDAPPILGVADAVAFAPLVDCIIVVVSAGFTNRHDLKEALDLLPQEKIAGFVLNRLKGVGKLYGRYSYRYARRDG